MSAPMVARRMALMGGCAAGAVLLNAESPMTMTFPGSKQPITVVIDSPEIRRLIGDQEKAQAEEDRFWREPHTREAGTQRISDMINHPYDFPSGREEFLDAMAKAPALTVERKTHAKVLEVSKARCLPGVTTTTFVRVSLDGKKPPSGTEVWVCLSATAFDGMP